MEEKILFETGGVFVSESRLVINGRSYDPAEITSVEIHPVEKKRTLPMTLIFCSMPLVFFQLFLWGIIILALGIICLIRTKDDFFVCVNGQRAEKGFAPVFPTYRRARKAADAIRRAADTRR